MKPLCLTHEELVDLTGKQRYSAQRRALRAMGIEHRSRPDGSVAVDRAYYETLTSGGLQVKRLSQEKTQPRWDDAA